MQLADFSVHFSVGEFASGERAFEVVRRSATFAHGGAVELLHGAEHELRFDTHSRELLPGSGVSYLETDGTRRHVTLTPLRRAYLRCGHRVRKPAASVQRCYRARRRVYRLK